jgi:hypothetical protein
MGAWALASRVESFQMTSGYGQHGGRVTSFDLNLDKDRTSISSVGPPDGIEHGPILGVTVEFGDFQVGPPGGTVGEASPLSGGGTAITVRFPRDEAYIFWRAIRDAQEHILVIGVDGNNAVTSCGVVVSEGFEQTEEDRRGRVNSALQRLGVPSNIE